MRAHHNERSRAAKTKHPLFLALASGALGKTGQTADPGRSGNGSIGNRASCFHQGATGGGSSRRDSAGAGARFGGRGDRCVEQRLRAGVV
jgi:hypothetical protein